VSLAGRASARCGVVAAGHAVGWQKGGSLAGAALGSEGADQVAQTAVGVVELLGDLRQRLTCDEDSPKGLILPLQGLGRVEEELLTNGVVHGGPPESVIAFSCGPSPDDIGKWWPESKVSEARVAERPGNQGLRRRNRQRTQERPPVRKVAAPGGRPRKRGDNKHTDFPSFPGNSGQVC
jgi:hypothetical protein